ncbi:MAG: hypothetical protein NXI31_15505 [bacterium]|nr:hypothetical protein [bacterium]
MRQTDLVQSVCREVLEDRDAFEFQGEGQFVRSEIATHLDRTEAAVRALLGRALARLGRKLA